MVLSKLQLKKTDILECEKYFNIDFLLREQNASALISEKSVLIVSSKSAEATLSYSLTVSYKVLKMTISSLVR